MHSPRRNKAVSRKHGSSSLGFDCWLVRNGMEWNGRNCWLKNRSRGSYHLFLIRSNRFPCQIQESSRISSKVFQRVLNFLLLPELVYKLSHQIPRMCSHPSRPYFALRQLQIEAVSSTRVRFLMPSRQGIMQKVSNHYSLNGNKRLLFTSTKNPSFP